MVRAFYYIPVILLLQAVLLQALLMQATTVTHTTQYIDDKKVICSLASHRGGRFCTIGDHQEHLNYTHVICTASVIDNSWRFTSSFNYDCTEMPRCTFSCDYRSRQDMLDDGAIRRKYMYVDIQHPRTYSVFISSYVSPRGIVGLVIFIVLVQLSVWLRLPAELYHIS